MLVLTTVLCSRSGDRQWFYASCPRAYDAMLVVPGVEHLLLIIGVDFCLLVLRPRGSVVLQGSHIMNGP